MIITHLILENFGVFRGRHRIDLSPQQLADEAMPVILFGGKNGAGKTTLLDAIRLCLYGRTSLGGRVRKDDYHGYIREHIHRPFDGNLLKNVSVSLGFEYVHAGVLSVYDATRSWRIDGNTVQESIHIQKNEEVFREVDSRHWDEFLRDLIPPGIADLFFFDGEQIQALADESTEAIALETAINGLLNIDLIGRLRSDLSLYSNQQAQRERTQLQAEAEQLQSRAQQLNQDASELRQDRAGLVARLDYLRKQTEHSRQVLVREGVSFLEQRYALEARQKELRRLIEQTENSIHELAAGLLPFAIAPNWSAKLRLRLQNETLAEKQQFITEVHEEYTAHLTTLLADKDFQKRAAPKLSTIAWMKLSNEVVNALHHGDAQTDIRSIHSLSPQAREQIKNNIENVLNEVPRLVTQLSAELERLEEEQTSVTRALRQVPDEAIANPLIANFQGLAEQVGEITQQIAILDEQLRQSESQAAEVERVRKKAWMEIAELGDVDIRIARAAKIQGILDHYQARITEEKLRRLEDRVAEYFNLLCRKQSLVSFVNIDPDRYTVSLHTQNGTVLPKSSLSAGERQLYAMALLWALRAVSGRQLPIIMDTPMGRLDTDHRRTLLTNFFPLAAHQLILLSTDTEVDVDAFALLQPYVSRAYLLNFNLEQGCTDVEQRYFAPIEQSS